MKPIGKRLPVVGSREGVLGNIEDKYALTNLPDIDCATLVPICQARCCRFACSLSEQDVAEGIVRWDVDNPYWVARREDSTCVHLEEGACAVYAQRPGVCRLYDCRRDPRVWLDFDRRIPARR